MLEVLAGAAADEGVWVVVRARLALPVFVLSALEEPPPLPGGVEHARHDVPGVPDQEYHAALREGLHQQGRPGRTVWLLDHQVAVGAEARTGVAYAVEDEAPDGPRPSLARRVAQDKVGATQVHLLSPFVEFPEETADHRLFPGLVAVQILHHAPEP